jgi:hypothetical protein
MISILGFTSLDLNRERREGLIHALRNAAERIFPENLTLNVHFVAEEFDSNRGKNLIQFIAIVPEDITLDQRRELSKQLHETIVGTLPDKEKAYGIVLFWPTAEKDAIAG